MNEAPLQIEIAYAEPQRAIVKSYLLARGSRVADALRLIDERGATGKVVLDVASA